ncbi:S26 family signal peptidase [Caulobacter hibisci]|uniref:S26 family signal peptidase n=1 Tax=Caulobacter hibisci TaxID=2035993 RepID=A0ABS0SXB9_9CAUL|nr:S26 family signal peptidase [Caulobacter hibisci]MBI1684275.1 S26 family signal peptidase [Caulobacter hibisci]
MQPRLVLALAAPALAAVALGPPIRPAPPLLLNTSASEPVGLYLHQDQVPRVGRVIAFRPPPAAWPYVAAAMPARARGGILKTIGAGEGDRVCTRGGRLAVNGRDVAPIASRDSRGRSLPHWEGCRALGAGEYFVVSTRIPNSFDSRYYGPVRRQDVIGVYRALGAPRRPAAA